MGVEPVEEGVGEMMDAIIFGLPLNEVTFFLIALSMFPWVFLPEPVGPLIGFGVSLMVAWIGGNHSLALAFMIAIGQNVIAVVLYVMVQTTRNGVGMHLFNGRRRVRRPRVRQGDRQTGGTSQVPFNTNKHNGKE
jgi:hypothetical protein